MSNPTATVSPGPESTSSDSFMVLWSITAPQKTFLADRLPDYKAALGKKSLPEFWDTLFEDWFKRWPSKDDGRALVEEQLKSWMVTNNRWHITTKQRKFLTDRIPDYKSAQAKKKLIDFWPFLYMHWFDRWPATEVAPQGLVEKKLKAWYNNNARVTASTRQVLNLNKPAKRTRRPAAAQTFCKVYWSKPLPDGTVLRNTIAAEWVAAWQKSKKFDPEIDVPRVAVNFINKVARRIFLKQLPLIHEEIEQHPDQLKHDNSEGSPDPGDEADDDEVKRALEYQAAIDAIPFSIEQAGAQIFKQSGLISLTMVAGPDPKQGGNLLIYSYPYGLTPSGQSFIHHTEDFKANFEDKFHQFAKMVFPPSERAKRSLPGTEKYRNYKLPPAAPEAATTPVLDSEKAKRTPTVGPSVSRVQDEADESSDSDSDIDVDLDIMFISPPGEPSRCVSDYERIRDENIARNQELLKSLGLDKPTFGPSTKTKKARGARKPKGTGQPSSRRSTRLASANTDANANVEGDTDADANAEGDAEGDAGAEGDADTNANAEGDADANVNANANTEGDAGAEGDADANANANANTEGDTDANANANANVEGDADAMEDMGDEADADGEPDPELAGVALVDNGLVNAPEWLQEAVKDLKKQSTNASWREVISKFVDFERSLGFLNGFIPSQRLAVGKHRPKEIVPWVKAARVASPTIKNPSAFGRQWLQWYTELQPDSRKLDDGSLLRAIPADCLWPELAKGSVNGFYSLLASFGWWLHATEVNKGNKDEVYKAMDDISWLLEVMVHGTTLKRASIGPADEEARPSKKARVA